MGQITSAYFQADFFGKCVFLGLFTLSFLCWSLLLYKIYVLQIARKDSKRFFLSIKRQKDSLLNLKPDRRKNRSYFEIPQPFFELFYVLKNKALEILEKNHYFIKGKINSEASVYLSRGDIDSLESQLITSINNECHKLDKNIFLLAMISSLAPFLGLLGTVWGILMTFSGLQASAAISSNSMVLSGLSTALVTTVLGLVIAIPALVSYTYLKNLIKTFTYEMESFSHLMLSTVELQYRAVELQVPVNSEKIQKVHV